VILVQMDLPSQLVGKTQLSNYGMSKAGKQLHLFVPTEAMFLEEEVSKLGMETESSQSSTTQTTKMCFSQEHGTALSRCGTCARAGRSGRSSGRC